MLSLGPRTKLCACIFIFFCFLFSSSKIYASYCPHVELYGQYDIDHFRMNHQCDSIGNLIIHHVATGFDSLYGIKHIRTFKIYDGSSALNSFKGLSGLNSVVNFFIQTKLPNQFLDFPHISIKNLYIDGAKTTDFTGLEFLTELSRLNLWHVSDLTSCNGLQNLESLDFLSIEDCDSLVNVSFPSVLKLKKLAMRRNPTLRISSFHSLGSISNFIIVDECFGLDSLLFPNLVAAKDMKFANSFTQGTFDIASLQEVDFLSFRECPTISGIILQNILNIGFLKVLECESLSVIQMDEIISLDRIQLTQCANLSLIHMDKLSMLHTLDLTECGVLSEIRFPSLTSLENCFFRSCSALSEIQNLGSVATPELVFIEGDCADTILISQANIHNTKEVILLNSDAKVFAITSLNSLKSFRLINNAKLQKVRLSSLTDGEMDILELTNNPDLQNFDFETLPEIRSIRSFIVTDNADLSFMKSLEFAFNFFVTNTNWTAWDFDQLIYVQNLTLQNNDQLSACCPLYQQIAGGVINNFTISDNSADCSELRSIYNTCGPPVDADGDQVLDVDDNCVNDYNISQIDSDGDGIGDVCDNCPQLLNPGQSDSNGNGIGDDCEYADYRTQLSIDNGDAIINTPSGLILKGIDNNCYRIIIDNEGDLRTIVVPCF